MDINEKAISLGLKLVCGKPSQFLLRKITGINPEHFVMSFSRDENGYWFADVPHWPRQFHDNLEMVAGADDYLTAVCSGANKVKLEVSTVAPENPGEWTVFSKTHETLMGGTYSVENCPVYHKKVWLCNVTKFVLGQHPQTIWVKVLR